LVNSSTQNCKFWNIGHNLLLTFPTQSMFIDVIPEHTLCKLLSHTWYFGTDNNIICGCLSNRSITWFQTFAMFCMLYVFFGVIPQRLNLICRSFHYLWRCNKQSVPKCRYIKFRRQGITQKKTYNRSITAYRNRD
jgi:hypothetical protein